MDAIDAVKKRYQMKPRETLEQVWGYLAHKQWQDGEPVSDAQLPTILNIYRSLGFDDFPALHGPAWRVEEANAVRADVVFDKWWLWIGDEGGRQFNRWFDKDNRKEMILAVRGENRSSFYINGKNPTLRPWRLDLKHNKLAQFVGDNPELSISINEKGDAFLGKDADYARVMFRLGSQ